MDRISQEREVELRPSILVFATRPGVRRLLSSLAAQLNWNLTFAAGADAAGINEGLRCLSSERFHLVVAALPAPGFSDLPAAIRAADPCARIIVLSHRPRSAEVVQALCLPVYGYFASPFSQASLEHVLSRAIDGATWEDEIQVSSALPEWLSLRVRCRIETAERLIPFLSAMKADLAPRVREEVMTAFREVLINAIEHGGKSDCRQTLDISYMRTPRAILYRLADPGGGFSFNRLPHAALSNTADHPFAHAEFREHAGLRPGGFGILLARNSVDEMLYNAKGNEVLLIKYTKGRR